MKIGIVAKPHHTDLSQLLQQVIRWLDEKDCETVLEAGVAEYYGLEQFAHQDLDRLPDLVDCIISFGGDGTLLRVARSIRGREAPILGVNMGSLGFLTGVTLDELYPALEELLAGTHRLDIRVMLKIEIHHQGDPVQTFHGLNDAVINKGALARIFSMDAFVNQDFIANFLADGLIIATPTGSTAYSLAAGGPILYPTLKSIVITPICSHTLTNRPLVVPASSTVRVVVKSGEDVNLTVDGQIGLPLESGDEILCTQSKFSVKLIKPGPKGYFDVLHEKLKWGQR